MDKLEYLNLGWNPIGNPALAAFGDCVAFPKLKQLWMEKCNFSDRDALSAFLENSCVRNVRILALNQNPFGESAHGAFLKRKVSNKIKRIYLYDCEMPDRLSSKILLEELYETTEFFM